MKPSQSIVKVALHSKDNPVQATLLFHHRIPSIPYRLFESANPYVVDDKKGAAKITTHV